MPEVKIVFVLLYWLLCSTLTWTYFSIVDGRADIINNILERYVECRAGGNRVGHDCHMLRQDLAAETIPALEVTYLISIAFLNFASLPFVVEFQAIKKCVRQAAKKLKSATKKT